MAERRVRELGPDDPRHGTTNGYGNLGCRCERCRQANRENHLAYMHKQRAAGRVLGRHGSTLAYDTGCRCQVCREAHNEKSRLYKAAQRRKRGTD